MRSFLGRVGEMALDSELQVKGRDLTQPGHKLLLSPLQAITVNLNHCQFISSVE